MKIILAVALSAVATCFGAAQELTAEARQLHEQLTVRLAPSIRAWVQREAQWMRSDPRWDERRVRLDAQTQFLAQPVIGNDLDALVFLVFMDVLEQLDREMPRPQVPPQPAKKTTKKKASPATNTVVDTRAKLSDEWKERRTKLAERVEELARQLSGFAETLLREIR